MEKSRVTPTKNVTIPLLELVAIILSVKIAALIRRELDTELKNETFWTDSKLVLGMTQLMLKIGCQAHAVFISYIHFLMRWCPKSDWETC